MTAAADDRHARPAAAGAPAASRAAAWLRRGDAGAAAAADAAGRRSTAPARAPLPLDAEECLTLARVVLGGVVPEGGGGPEAACGDAATDGVRPGLGPRLVAVSGRVAALGAWVAEAFPSGPAADDRVVLDRLAASLDYADPTRGHGVADAGGIPPAAAVLRQAVAAAVAHLRLREEFLVAVADARLEAMRELAYGAGHEINNPLANIATRAQALLLEESDSERRRRLATIVDQAFRARDMIGGLMVFARPPKPRRAAADVGELVAAVIESVRSQAAARGARLEYSPSPTPRSAFVDRVQVEEALRVVVLNALEAVEPGGRVVIGVEGSTVGPCARIAITIGDDGRGMSAADAKRAFDPFYSGREAGRGAGLGLPKAWRLVDASGGSVVLESRPGRGTLATIALPATADEPATTPRGGAAAADEIAVTPSAG